jgi:hypothetical protein
VSKAAASLIRQGYLEESVVSEGFGRPWKLLQLAERTANVGGGGRRGQLLGRKREARRLDFRGGCALV